MDINELTKSAIAKAKEVKRMAEANAYQTLKEEFEPRIQRLVSQSIAEEEDEEDVEIDISVPGEDPAIGFGGEEGDTMMSDPEGIDAEMPPADDVPLEDEDPEAMELEALMRELDGDLDEGEEELDFSDTIDNDPIMGEGDGSYDEKVPSRKPNTESKLREMDDEEDMFAEWSDAELDEALEMIEAEEMGTEEDDMMEEECGYDDKVSERRPNTEVRQLRARVNKLTEERNKALQVVTYLKSTINEVNLLNAKLMYSQKLMGQFDLTEKQKVGVLEAFDRATSVREVKGKYVDLATMLKEHKGQRKQRNLKEGAASKPIQQLSPKKQMNEQYDFAPRWKGLAGIEPNNIYG